MKEIRAGVEGFVERLESETKDMELYGPLPEQEECPICFLPLPRSDKELLYMACCGQTLCGGGSHASFFIGGKRSKSYLCAFCRFETQLDDLGKALIAQYNVRAEKNDADAINNLAENYRVGECGLPKDDVMALRLYLRAAELGCLAAIGNLATSFFRDDDVLQDADFAMQLATIAAKRGHLVSYHLIGNIYHEQGDVENTAKSWIFAAKAGHSDSMKALRTYKIDGTDVVSDDDLEAIDEAYKEAIKLEWSEEREAFKIFTSKRV